MTNNIFPKLLKSKIFCREYKYSINEKGDEKSQLYFYISEDVLKINGSVCENSFRRKLYDYN